MTYIRKTAHVSDTIVKKEIVSWTWQPFASVFPGKCLRIIQISAENGIKTRIAMRQHV